MTAPDAATLRRSPEPVRQRSLPAMRAARNPLAAPNPDTVAHEEIRAWASPRTAQQRARRATKTRKTPQRERCTDPATCDRSFAEAELELMQAMQDYKQRSG